MVAAIFAVVAGHEALMSVLREGRWLGYDCLGAGGAFPKQDYPVLIVPSEVSGETGQTGAALGRAIGVFTATDWSGALPEPVYLDGLRYSGFTPARVTRLAPVGEGVEITQDMINQHGLTGRGDEPRRLKWMSIAVTWEVYSGVKEELRRRTRPLARVLAGYEELADLQEPPAWAGIPPMPDLALPRTTVYELARAATADYDSRRADEARLAGLPAPPPLWWDDSHDFVRRMIFDYLARLAGELDPTAERERVLATIVDAYPYLAIDCAANWPAG